MNPLVLDQLMNADPILMILIFGTILIAGAALVIFRCATFLYNTIKKAVQDGRQHD